MFDSLRCVAQGTGTRKDNEEIIDWVWSVGGAGTSRRVTKKLGPDTLNGTETYTLPDGSIMIDTYHLTRISP